MGGRGWRTKSEAPGSTFSYNKHRIHVHRGFPLVQPRPLRIQFQRAAKEQCDAIFATELQRHGGSIGGRNSAGALGENDSERSVLMNSSGNSLFLCVSVVNCMARSSMSTFPRPETQISKPKPQAVDDWNLLRDNCSICCRGMD